FVREKVAALAPVRDAVRQTLAAVPGCTVPRADGAFYFLLRLDTTQRPLDLVEQLILEHRIAVLPGNAFGITSGCHLRVAYAAFPPAPILGAVGRLAEGLKVLLR